MRSLLVALFVCCFSALYAQTGGKNAFTFLDLPFSARAAGLGGNFITVRDEHITSGLQNPAMLNRDMSGQGMLSQSLLAGGINFGSLNYARTFNEVNYAAQFKYLAYGKMKRTDYTGADLGTFSPGDFALGISAAKSINERMHIGATLNFLYSQLDSYIAAGNSLDIGGAYTDPEKRLVVSGVVRNLGVQWKGYTPGNKSPLPMEIQLGVSHKLAHAPFRFSLIGQELQQWDLTYKDPNQKISIDPLTGDTLKTENPKFFGKLARHAVIQTEILVGKKLHLRFGFDYLRRQELKVIQRPGLSGFSFGVGMYFKRFTLEYGLMSYSAAGFQNQLSLTVNLGRKP